MSENEILKRITDGIANIDSEGTEKVCKEAMTIGVIPIKAIEALSKGMTVVGERFEAKEYFLSELIMAGEIMKDAQAIIKPYLTSSAMEVLGKVVLGTVRGDLHDLGKNIVGTLLSTSGFKVVDLGVDVPPESFVETVRTVRPNVLGMSALLRATVPEMGNVVNALEEAGLRQQVKIVVGGLPLNQEYARKLGADYYAKDAVEGVEICKRLVVGQW